MENIEKEVQATKELCQVNSNLQDLKSDYQLKLDWIKNFNMSFGKQTGYNCKKCNNRAWFAVLVGDYIKMQPCECQLHRNNFKELMKHGAGYKEKYFGAERAYSTDFEDFNTNSDITRKMKKASQDFIAQYPNKWLYFGGQSGSGKTMLTSAILTIMETKGVSCEYMSWMPDVRDLKIMLYETKTDYQKKIAEYKSVPLLLIDDLFKANVTESDKGIAYEILDERYRNNLATIITSEKYMSELLNIDEALGGRIKERSLVVTIERSGEKNYRLRKERREF